MKEIRHVESKRAQIREYKFSKYLYRIARKKDILWDLAQSCKLMLSYYSSAHKMCYTFVIYENYNILRYVGRKFLQKSFSQNETEIPSPKDRALIT